MTKSIYRKRKSVFTKKSSSTLGKRVLIRSGFVATGLILGGTFGLAISGTSTGLATLAGTMAGLVTAQHIATMHFKKQAKLEKKPKKQREMLK